MKLLFFISLFYIGSNLNAQQSEIQKLNCLILVDIRYEGTINLYSNKGKVIKRLKHNLKDEDYLILKITGKNDSMYFVEANYVIAGFISKGWIKKKNSALGIYSKNYSSSLNLYEYPQKNSKVQSTIYEYSPDFLHVIDCQSNWLFVETKIENKKYEGWMDPKTQCANAYSNCN